jgi:hypothetical protein
MKQVLVKGGTVSVEETPPPSPGPGMALVRVSHSLISSGTESAFVDSMGVAGYALKKARDPPQHREGPAQARLRRHSRHP